MCMIKHVEIEEKRRMLCCGKSTLGCLFGFWAGLCDCLYYHYFIFKHHFISLPDSTLLCCSQLILNIYSIHFNAPANAIFPMASELPRFCRLQRQGASMDWGTWRVGQVYKDLRCICGRVDSWIFHSHSFSGQYTTSAAISVHFLYLLSLGMSRSQLPQHLWVP